VCTGPLGSRPALAALTGFAKATPAERKVQGPHAPRQLRRNHDDERWPLLCYCHPCNLGPELAAGWAACKRHQVQAWSGGLGSVGHSTEPAAVSWSLPFPPWPQAKAAPLRGREERTTHVLRYTGCSRLLPHPRRESDTHRPQHLSRAREARPARGGERREGAYRPTAMADDGRGIAAVPPAAWALGQSQGFLQFYIYSRRAALFCQNMGGAHQEFHLQEQ